MNWLDCLNQSLAYIEEHLEEEIDYGEVAMNYRIEEKEGFRLVGVKEAITTANGENFIKVPKVWDRLWNEGVYEEITTLANGSPRGVMGVCTNFREGEFDYYVAVSSDKAVPDHMEALEVKAGTWVTFECKGVQGIQDTFKRLYSEWFPTSGYEHSGGPEIEWYPGEDMNTEDFGCEVWIPIVKK